MFTWICPKCGREVPPAYDECPDCAAKTTASAVAGTAPPSGTVAPPQQTTAAPAGPRGRRPLWAAGPQETVAAPPAPSYAPPPPPPPPVAAAPLPPPEAPPAYRPHQATSPLFQEAPAPPRYAPQQARPQTPKWLTGVAIGVIAVMALGAIYWFFGRPQPTSAVTETAAAVTAPPVATPTGNPVEKFVEVTGVRFEPISKGIVVKFIVVNHSDQDLVGLTGSANITARTNTGGEVPVGSVKFQTSLAGHASQELSLPFETKKKMVDMPDWQNVGVKVSITSPSGA